MRYTLLTFILGVALSGCGFFEGGDAGSNDTSNAFSISYYGGSQFDFNDTIGDVATSDFDGTNTLVTLRGRLLNDGTHAYNVVISFPGEQSGTFSVGSGTASSSYLNVDAITDGGDWDGSFNASTSGCVDTADIAAINAGNVVVSGYGPVGGRVIGTFNFTYRNQLQCLGLKRFTGSFDVPRCTDNRDTNTEPCL